MANLNNYYAVINQDFVHHLKVEWHIYKISVPPDADEFIGAVKVLREAIFTTESDGTIELSTTLHQYLVLLALWDNPLKVKQYLDGKKLTSIGLEDI